MNPDLDSELDRFVEKCESAWREAASADAVDVAALLPPIEHPGYATIAVELLRVDLDHRFSRGVNPGLSSYVSRFPQALSDPERLSELAYEEYRLRVQSGESVEPTEYAREFRVPVDHWRDQATISTVGPTEDSVVEDHPSRDETLQPQAAFGDFVLERELGSGALARVFLARQTGIADRNVVLKFTAIRTVEIDRLGKLQHSNIVPVLSVHEYENGAALCMPYLGESTLAVLPGARRSSDVDDSGLPQSIAWKLKSPADYEAFVLQTAIGIASGLQHAHEHDVVHGDLKPANVLLADDGRPLLLDFNLSGDLTNLRPEVIGGTFRYMPPEHKRAFQSGDASVRPDVRSDIFSFGVILLELLTGSVEADSDEAQQKLNAVSPAFAAIVRKCIAADPVGRYQTSDALLDDLQRHSKHLPLQHQPEPSFSERIRKFARRHPSLVSTATVGVISVLVLSTIAFAWVTRLKRLQIADAYDTFHEFMDESPRTTALLSIRRDETGAIDEGLAEAERLLAPFEKNAGVEAIKLLDREDQRTQREAIGYLLYSVAHGHWMRSEVSQDPKRSDAELIAAGVFNKRARDWFESELGQVPLAVIAQESRFKGEPGSGTFRDQPADTASRVEKLLFARELMEARQFEQTWRYLDRCKAGMQGDSRYWTLLGGAYAALEKNEKAEICLSAALSINPRSWFAYTDRGLARLALAQNADAETDFSHVIRLRPDYWGGYLNRALAREKQGLYSKAIADLDKVIELGGPTRAYFLRARYHGMNGNRDGWEADRKLGLETKPNDEKSWVSRGLARMRNDPKGALEDFQQAIELNPLSRDGWRNTAHVLSERLDDVDGSIAALGKIIDAGLEDPGAYAGRAVLHARAGREEAAINDINRALDLDDDPMTEYQAACVFALLSKYNGELKPRAFSLLAASFQKLPHVLIRFAKTDPDLKSIQSDETYRKIEEASRDLFEIKKRGAK